MGPGQSLLSLAHALEKVSLPPLRLVDLSGGNAAETGPSNTNCRRAAPGRQPKSADLPRLQQRFLHVRQCCSGAVLGQARPNEALRPSRGQGMSIFARVGDARPAIDQSSRCRKAGHQEPPLFNLRSCSSAWSRALRRSCISCSNFSMFAARLCSGPSASQRACSAADASASCWRRSI